MGNLIIYDEEMIQSCINCKGLFKTTRYGHDECFNCRTNKTKSFKIEIFKDVYFEERIARPCYDKKLNQIKNSFHQKRIRFYGKVNHFWVLIKNCDYENCSKRINIFFYSNKITDCNSKHSVNPLIPSYCGYHSVSPKGFAKINKLDVWPEEVINDA